MLWLVEAWLASAGFLGLCRANAAFTGVRCFLRLGRLVREIVFSVSLACS